MKTAAGIKKISFKNSQKVAVSDTLRCVKTPLTNVYKDFTTLISGILLIITFAPKIF